MILQLIIVSNVLARFPLNVKKTMITEVTSTLLVTSDLTLLTSMAHMKWAMEVLGQGFALPLEELSITQETTQLYSQWLFEPQMRPMAFRQAAGTADEQLLYQVWHLRYPTSKQLHELSPIALINDYIVHFIDDISSLLAAIPSPVDITSIIRI